MHYGFFRTFYASLFFRFYMNSAQKKLCVTMGKTLHHSAVNTKSLSKFGECLFFKP